MGRQLLAALEPLLKTNETLAIFQSEGRYHSVEFSFVIGNWTGQFDELMKSDLYNILPNPDKNDEADPDSVFNNPQSEYYSVSKLNNLSHTTQGKGIFLFHCNIRSFTKNLTLLNDMLYFLDSRPDVMAITKTRLSSNSVSNLDISN